MNATPDELVRLERKEAGLAQEKAGTLAKLDAEIDAAKQAPYPDQARIETLENRRAGAVKTYDHHLEAVRGGLAVVRAELAAQQAARDAETRQAGEREEQLAKAKARRGFPGDDAAFNAAWPAIWAGMQAQRATAAANDPRRVVVRL